MLEQAIAHVECKVVSRMETPDHWITYCEATEGNVANADKKTAVHRRKVCPLRCADHVLQGQTWLLRASQADQTAP